MLEKKCNKCHELITKCVKTSEGDRYCNHCGYVLGTSVSPSTWACECGNVVIHHGGDERPMCDVCEVPMNCYSARPSRISGAGINNDLDFGLAFLMEAQS